MQKQPVTTYRNSCNIMKNVTQHTCKQDMHRVKLQLKNSHAKPAGNNTQNMEIQNTNTACKPCNKKNQTACSWCNNSTNTTSTSHCLRTIRSPNVNVQLDFLIFNIIKLCFTFSFLPIIEVLYYISLFTYTVELLNTTLNSAEHRDLIGQM